MGVFKSLMDKAKAKKDELTEKATTLAAEKATDMAIERGKQATRSAVEQAGKTLKNAGASIEEALFGPDSEGQAPPPSAKKPERKKPRDDAAEAAAKRAAKEQRMEREVDEELAALKRKIAKK